MKTWQVFLLIFSASLLFVILYKISPETGTNVPARTSNPVQNFITTVNESGSNKKITLLMTGDVMIGRSVMSKSLAGDNPGYPFEFVWERLKSADIVFANLENPVIENCPKHDSGFKFCAEPKMLKGLTDSGIDVVNLANNHTLNWGKNGFEETKKHLENVGIDYVGDGNLVVKEVAGTKFGFLGFDYVVTHPKQHDLDLITESKKDVDVLVVAVHWGVEYTDKPNTFQKTVAKSLLSAGADVIAGTHPHWVQTHETIDGKPVFYSFGNFVFDQMWSEETKKGAVGELTYQNKVIVGEKMLPVYMENFAQPKFVEN